MYSATATPAATPSPRLTRRLTEPELDAVLGLYNHYVETNDVPRGTAIGIVDEHTAIVAVEHDDICMFVLVESWVPWFLPTPHEAMLYLEKLADRAVESIADVHECVRLFGKMQQNRASREHAVRVANTVAINVGHLKSVIHNQVHHRAMRPMTADDVASAHLHVRRIIGASA